MEQLDFPDFFVKLFKVKYSCRNLLRLIYNLTPGVTYKSFYSTQKRIQSPVKQTSNTMELFATLINVLQPLTIFTKSSSVFDSYFFIVPLQQECEEKWNRKTSNSKMFYDAVDKFWRPRLRINYAKTR